jgi:2-polyprenyl-3-methyl-5-hydroxy-6-metoxy-1,4-benzoquinol methylase
MIEEKNQIPLWDDPEKDYRQRYQLPDQFLWDEAALARLDFDGYMSTVISLLPNPPAKILEAGCGPGLGARLLVEHGFQVVGIDYNQRGVAFAQILVPEAKFIHHDLRVLSEIEELQTSFDAVTIVEVIEHIPPDFHPILLKGIHNVLCPHGTLVLSVPSAGMPLNKWDYKHFSLQEIINLIEQSGFQVKGVIYQHRLHWLFSGRTWQFLTNQYYDLRFARSILRSLFLKRFNTTENPNQAGRYIIKAEKR